jgi:hypothetical protein
VSSETVATVRRFVEAFNRLDIDAALAECDSEVVLHEWPQAPGARSYRGHDGLRAALGNWFESWEWMQVDVEDVVEIGDRALVTLLQRARGRGSGIEVDVRTFAVYTFRDRKMNNMELFTEREPALEAAGLATNYQEEKR